MQFSFYNQYQNTLPQPFLHFLVYFFFLNIRLTFIYNILDYLKIHICQLKVPFHGAHHTCISVPIPMEISKLTKVVFTIRALIG